MLLILYRFMHVPFATVHAISCADLFIACRFISRANSFHPGFSKVHGFISRTDLFHARIHVTHSLQKAMQFQCRFILCVDLFHARIYFMHRLISRMDLFCARFSKVYAISCAWNNISLFRTLNDLGNWQIDAWTWRKCAQSWSDRARREIEMKKIEKKSSIISKNEGFRLKNAWRF